MLSRPGLFVLNVMSQQTVVKICTLESWDSIDLAREVSLDHFEERTFKKGTYRKSSFMKNIFRKESYLLIFDNTTQSTFLN